MTEEKNVQKIRADHLIWQPDRDRKPILNDICLELFAGEFYGVLGPNGAGKTSLARQILKLQKPNKGTVALDGQKVSKIRRDALARQLSFLPQSIRGDVEFSVYEVVAMGREPYRKRFLGLGSKDREIIEQALAAANCTHLKEKPVSCLSGGERQRVMIARTIAQDTPWIFLDEPISNLDVKHQMELMQTLKKLQEQGRTVIAVLHDMNLAALFCTEMILMKQGSVFAAGKPRDVLTKENLRQVYEVEFTFLERGEGEMPYITPCYSAQLVQTRSGVCE